MAPPTFLQSLAVIPTEEKDVYESVSLWRPYGARGVFGGHVIGLALVAAGKTVESRLGLHSQHCYFLLPAQPDVNLRLEVERLRDGRSYANRLVRAKQGGKVVFVLLSSYTLPPIKLPALPGDDETPFSFAPSIPAVQLVDAVGYGDSKPATSRSLSFALGSTGQDTGPAKLGGTQGSHVVVKPAAKWHIPLLQGVASYEDCVEEETRWANYLEQSGKDVDERSRKRVNEYVRERKESPVSIAVAKYTTGTLPHNFRLIWLRARLGPGEHADEETSKAMIGYMTDFQFIGTVARAVGLTSATKPSIGMLASLDHSTTFYPFPEGFDINKPLLHVMEAAMSDIAAGRGITRGLLYDVHGNLIAVTQQEGVVRARLQGLEPKDKGVLEGGGEDPNEPKAKL